MPNYNQMSTTNTSGQYPAAQPSIERGGHIAPQAKAYLRKNSITLGIENLWDRTKAVEAIYIAFAEGRALGQIEKGGEV